MPSRKVPSLLPATLILAGNFLTVAHAQFVQQGPKLAASDAIGEASQGSAVTMSADGNTVIVGGSGDNNGVGAAWVYTRSGTTWTEQAKLVPNNTIGTYANFGAAVAISADGNTAIIGGPGDATSTTNAGASWVFVRNSGQWTQQAKLLGPIEPASTCAACHNSFKPVTAADYQPVYQGSEVSISADGNTAMVGSTSDHHGRGSAWVYTRANGTWTSPAALLLASGVTDRAYQGAVALSGDGLTALVGATGENGSVGAAWVYALGNGTWIQQAELTATGAYSQGSATALSYDGNTAILGARITQTGVSGPDSHSAAVAFTRAFHSGSAAWTQQGGILVGVDDLGTSSPPPVGLSGDGNTAIVGGPGDGGDYAAPGSAWVFRRYAGVWSQLGGKIVGAGYSGLESEQGATVAISGDGNSAIVGGPGDNVDVGASWVWVYSYEPPPLLQQAKLTGNDASSTPPKEGYSLAMSGDGKTAAVGGPSDASEQLYGADADAYGSVWFYTLTNGAWTQQGSKIQVLADDMNGINVGWCVGLSGSGNTAVIGRWFGYGVSYIFTQSGGTWTQQAMLSTSDPSPYAITMAPWSCAISGDGNTVIEGALEGSAYIFAYDGTEWTQQAYLSPSDWTAQGNGRPFGMAAAISYDGNTVLVGGPNDSSNVGAAWVFTRDNTGAWTQQGSKLSGSDHVGAAQQGTSVALSGDGNTAIVGGPADNSSLGAAWVYTRSAGVWTQQGGKLTAGEGGQGQGVAISQDGNTAAVGAISDNYTTGAVWMYRRNSGVWSQEGMKLVGTGAIGTAQQGGAIAMSADGATLIESGVKDNIGVGAAWVFSSGTPQATHLAVSAPVLAGSGVAFNFSVIALDANNALVTGYTGPILISTSDGAGAVPSGNQTLVNGAGTFSATLKTLGTQSITAVDATSSSIAGISGDIVVTPPPATHFQVSVPGTVGRNTAFPFTVTALDASGNTSTSYAGTVHFTSSDTQAVLPPDSTLTNGTGTFSATLATVANQTITAANTVSSISGVSNPIAVTLYSKCDVNHHGSTNVADVQSVINEALGAAQAVDDMNTDGMVNVVDVQIVINAALGLLCGGS